MDSEDQTNLTETAVKDEATEAEVNETNEETSTKEETAPQEAQDDSEEVDIEGDTLKLPKQLAAKVRAGFMKNADYTQKTQDVAEQRRAIETERQQFEQQRQQHSEFMEDIANLKSLDKQLDQFKNIDWAEFARQNAVEAQAMYMRQQQMRDYRAELVASMDHKSRALQEARERDIANARQKAQEALTKADPSLGWDGKFDSEKSTKLTEFGKKLGFSQDELQSIASPVAIKALNLAMIGAQYLEQQRKNIAPKPPEAKPVPEVNTSRATPVPSGLDDRLNAAEWYKRRDEQVAAKHRRIRPAPSR